MFDCHIHTGFSPDSSANLEGYINIAIENKLKGITITDHLDFKSNGKIERINEFLDKTKLVNEHLAYLQRIKDKYKKDLDIFIGFEVDANNLPIAREEAQKALNIKELDFNILSTHQVEDRPLYLGMEFFSDEKIDSYNKYFESVLKSVKYFENFCVYGHLDYITRYSKFNDNNVHINEHKELIDEILKTIISKDSGIEVNTSGIRYGRDDFYPQKDIVKRYKELGGKIITVGSDSHINSTVGCDFEIAREYLKECGFNEATYFKNRQPIFYKL